MLDHSFKIYLSDPVRFRCNEICLSCIITLPFQVKKTEIRSYTYKIFRTIVSQNWTISWVFIFSKILSDSGYKTPAKILQDSDIKKRIQLDCMILVWSYQFIWDSWKKEHTSVHNADLIWSCTTWRAFFPINEIMVELLL
jgi:hypothetical protein